MDHRAAHPVLPKSVMALAGETDPLPVFFHDLNNLLGVVMGNAELLLDVDTNEERRARRIRAISTAATQAAELVVRLQHQLSLPNDRH